MIKIRILDLICHLPAEFTFEDLIRELATGQIFRVHPVM